MNKNRMKYEAYTAAAKELEEYISKHKDVLNEQIINRLNKSVTVLKNNAASVKVRMKYFGE